MLAPIAAPPRAPFAAFPRTLPREGLELLELPNKLLRKLQKTGGALRKGKKRRKAKPIRKPCF
jgi:hypothetical protein